MTFVHLVLVSLLIYVAGRIVIECARCRWCEGWKLGHDEDCLHNMDNPDRRWWV